MGGTAAETKAAVTWRRSAVAVAVALASAGAIWWLTGWLETVQEGGAALEAKRLDASETAQGLRRDARDLVDKLAGLTLEVSGLREEVRTSSDKIAGQIAAALGEVSRDVAKLQAEVAALQQFEKFSEREADKLAKAVAELRERLEAIEKR